MILKLLLLFSIKVNSFTSKKKVAIVTGGTRGIGKSISEVMAKNNYDLLINYNNDVNNAIKTATFLKDEYKCNIHLISGDISSIKTRNKIFECFDNKYKSSELGAIIHNAGQFIGITSSNEKGLVADFGKNSDSIINENGNPDFEIAHYYQRMYGDAFMDLCERGASRMGKTGGSLIGISSPGCTLQYKPQPGYFLPGSGKCIMEYAMRSFALKYASKNINCNVVIPGVTTTEAWDRIGKIRNCSGNDIITSMSSKISPNGPITSLSVANGIAFLCSNYGRPITGVSLPIDNGVHLKA